MVGGRRLAEFPRLRAQCRLATTKHCSFRDVTAKTASKTLEKPKKRN